MNKSNKPKKILLLDDDLDFQELIRDYFKPRGYEMICFPTAEKGIVEMIQSSVTSDPIDLVLTDFRLPNMNGIELIEEIKRVAPHTPIILITAHGNLNLAVEAIEKGATDFVVKPIQFPQLSLCMERALYFSALQRENLALKSALEKSNTDGVNLVAKSHVMKSLIDLTRRIATSDSTVLITGESGSGKEVIARLIHSSSRRANEPFVAINCSAIPEALLESELFGHARGSFTGAEDTKIGLFEEADGGTLFLDEIGDLSLPLQAKLLRVIQERKIKRVGENQYRDINVRLLAATHKNMAKAVEEKKFREDLFFRINVIPIKVPPLRERREDLLPLAEYFLRKFKFKNNSNIKGFSKDVLRFILRHEWKGNVRELENAVERAVVLCDGPMIEETDFHFNDSANSDSGATAEAENLPLTDTQVESLLEKYKEEDALPLDTTAPVNASTPDTSTRAAESPGVVGTNGGPYAPLLSVGEMVSLETLELRYIKYVLELSDGVKDRAAKTLRVDRKTLYRKLEALDDLSSPA